VISHQHKFTDDKMPTDNKGASYTYKNSGTNSQVRHPVAFIEA
jgi:hypothetical protein